MPRFRTIGAITACLLVVLSVSFPAAAQSIEVAKHEFDVILAASQYNYERWVANVWGVAAVVLGAMGWVVTSKNARVFFRENKGARVGALAVTILVAVTNAMSQMYLASRSRELAKALCDSELVSQAEWKTKCKPEWVLQSGNEVFDQYLITLVNEILTLAAMLLLFGVFAYMLWSLKHWSEPETSEGA